MASPTPSYTNPQGPPLRLPKLSYRTKSSDNESVSSASTGFSRSTASTTPTSPLHSDFCLSPRSPPLEMSLPSSPSQSSFAPSPKAPSNLTKKRSKFLSGLFGAKEPSAQALQDYERQLMKNGRGRITAVGMPGVSSAKLPATVPRVNSKWDGAPRTLKEKEKKKHNDASRQSISGLSRQPGSSASERSEHRATSTPDSSSRRLSRGTLGGVSTRSGSSNNLADLYGWETNGSHSASSTINFSAEHRSTTSRSAPSLQPNSPLLRQEPPPPPVVDFPSTELSLLSPLGSPNPPSLSNSPMLTPYDSSPVTPDTPPLFMSLDSPKLEASPEESTKFTLLEAPEPTKEVVVKSAGINILGPPAAAKRKPKITPLQPSDHRPRTSGARTQSSSIFSREVSVPKVVPPPRPSLASCFPNTIRALSSDSPANVPVRRNSTRERLVLGINSKNPTAAQWHSPEQAKGVNPEGERIITPTPEGGKSTRKKSRMTLFRK